MMAASSCFAQYTPKVTAASIAAAGGNLNFAPGWYTNALPFSQSLNQLQAETVRNFNVGSYYLGVGQFFWSMTNWQYGLSNYMSAGIVDAFKGHFMFVIGEPNMSTNLDASGLITYSSTMYPLGMPWFIAWGHTNNIMTGIYLNYNNVATRSELTNGVAIGDLAATISILPNIYRDCTNVLGWKADLLDAEVSQPSIGSGYWDQPNEGQDRSWVLATNKFFVLNVLHEVQRAIQDCSTPIAPYMTVAGDWTNLWNTRVISTNPVALFYGSIVPWPDMIGYVNEYYVPSAGAQMLLSFKSFNTYSDQITAESNLVSIVDATVHEWPNMRGGNWPVVGSVSWTSSDAEGTTNAMAIMTMFGTQVYQEGATTRQANPGFRDAWLDPAEPHCHYLTNFVVGTQSADVVWKRGIDGNYWLLLWNHSSNATATVNIPLNWFCAAKGDVTYHDTMRMDSVSMSSGGVITLSAGPFRVKWIELNTVHGTGYFNQQLNDYAATGVTTTWTSTGVGITNVPPGTYNIMLVFDAYTSGGTGGVMVQISATNGDSGVVWGQYAPSRDQTYSAVSGQCAIINSSGTQPFVSADSGAATGLSGLAFGTLTTTTTNTYQFWIRQHTLDAGNTPHLYHSYITFKAP